ncbi:hypothetical protein H2201_004674 [Coniosporium apollinis]|uniref:Kinesin-like protein KIF22 n=1 Tax=Coniosporium apollinis TaxID=61459 RepID=A0ABQ9NV74_9PEZI|nr:hypothetical protein H2201_004674 [Coniosporium apollinis]
MSVRVVARIRPLLKLELDKDSIITAAPAGNETVGSPTVVRIPNPKNEAEHFSFQFNSVYDQEATQQDIYDHEVAPTVKHLFNGFDTTIFAYGVTGTGKTHTMRGGKSLADRGVIPRLLSSIYRRSRKIEKDSGGSTQVEVAMSYYEIYCDRVYDLFEPPDKRTPSGLPIRDNNGKTVVVGLTERPCTTLKEFEQLYDQANVNRSTSATKLNAHSSRSHAILCVKVTQTTETHARISTASAIDLAGSEDNRRTENVKDRMVESASINKSLFVLAQCVEAISRKQSRIPYRESKMTRILSLGQNNGLTLMILNLAPVRSYHLDTLSSLNFANRTKKIEVCEVENEPVLRNIKGKPSATANITGSNIQRQPLRPLTACVNANLADPERKTEKPVKAFSVYSDKNKPARSSGIPSQVRKAESHKRPLDASTAGAPRPTKMTRPSDPKLTTRADPSLSKESIEAMIDAKIEARLANHVLSDNTAASLQTIPEELQRRLDALEQRVEEKEDDRAQGLQYLLMAKQHHVRGEKASELKMYQLALPFFPENEKLGQKILALQEKLRLKREEKTSRQPDTSEAYAVAMPWQKREAPEPVPAALDREDRDKQHRNCSPDDKEYQDQPVPGADDNDEYVSDDGFRFKAKTKSKSHGARSKVQFFRDAHESVESGGRTHTPRTQHIIHVINSRDPAQIRLLKGVGAKKAEAIVNSLCEMDDGEEGQLITDLEQLGRLRGVGAKTVENMRAGLAI